MEGNHPLLWLAVIAIGAYHGLNPGMGWPLALSRALFERRESAVFSTLGPIATGHVLAMAVVLLPFALLVRVFDHARGIGITAGLVVAGFGLYRLVDRRHPYFLARIRPTQVALWSFLVAMAHGAGFMLVPVMLGLCVSAPAQVTRDGLGTAHSAMMVLMANDIATALAVALVHTLAMVAVGGLVAWAVFRYLGLRFLSRSWFDLDRVWAASLVATGLIATGTAAL